MPTDLPNERSIRPAGSMELDPAAGNVATDETPRLIASNKVEGTPAYAGDGTHLGTIDNFMVDKVSGQVAYAVLSFGGFLGLGESHRPVPWRALRYDVDLGGYVLDIDRDTLAGAPSHGPGEDAFADPAYGGRIDDHYGAGRRVTA